MPLRLLRFAVARKYPEPRMFRRHDALEGSYDAVIIGGGGHGLAAAYYLARDHGMRRVAVLERGYIGGGNTGRNTTFAIAPEAAKRWIRERHPKLHILSTGRSIDLYKDIGKPGEVAARYGFESLTGTHLVGHTRMATESAVTPDRAHPFTAGEDFCLVHNGSLSNPNSIRRTLEPLGIAFDTDNDTEAACRFLEWRMREGDDLETALQKGFDELDGFYTFLMGTKDQLAIIRDAFACKPAVVAETDDYVAIASEFRSLARLPDVKHATIFEPKPEEMYVWRV